jgi:hypothetical protein
MKKSIFILAICFFLFQTAMAQDQTKTPAPAATPTPALSRPTRLTDSPPSYYPATADVSSLDGIMKAIYDSISGEAGAPRNWERFRSLFIPDARLIPTGKDPKTGVVGAKTYTPDGYIERASPFFAKEGFYEAEIARRVETYGSITHVFSTYASFHSKKDGEKPFARGINSFQLMFDGNRWWVVTIYWQGETPENPLPEKYLKNGN